MSGGRASGKSGGKVPQSFVSWGLYHKKGNEFVRAGFNWWEAWGPVYLGGTERLRQLYD